MNVSWRNYFGSHVTKCTTQKSKAAYSGFTLIELLVVISIISLLIALLLPVLSKAKASAANIKCLTNEMQIGVLAMQYVTENQDRLPIIIGADVNHIPVESGGQILL